MDQSICAGIDIGGTNTKYSFVDRSGKIIFKSEVPTGNSADPNELIERVCNELKHSANRLGIQDLLAGIGIGAPNGNYFSGTVEFAPNLNWYGIIPVAKMFEDRMNVKTFLTNDANAAAMGEMYFGSAKGMKDFVFITLGTGLGSGIVVNGDLVYGHDGFAGEMGHVIVIQNGRQCGCGRKGCLEQYCSATGLVKTYLEFLANEDPEKFSAIDKTTVNSKSIYEMALSGDKVAINSFNYTGEILGFALANTVAYTSPEAFFLFGGLAEAGELLLVPTKISFEKNLLSIYKNKIAISVSGLPESDAALLGASSLAWNELNKISQ